jgi:hypothetical protein
MPKLADASKDIDLSGLKRRTVEKTQAALFEVEPSWSDLWWAMPSFEMGDARPMYRITVNLYSVDDLNEFGRVIGMKVTPKTDSITFPKENLSKPSDWRYVDE